MKPNNELSILKNDSDDVVTKNFYPKSEEEGLRLDVLLTQRFNQWSRTEWQERIRSGHVCIDDQKCNPSERIRKKQLISYYFLSKPEPQVNRQIHTVYEDKYILLVNKPSNLPVHPSGAYRKHTLYNILKEKWGEKAQVYLIHRLDRETSGLMLVAKNKQAASLLQTDFQKGRVQKEYIVFVEGLFPDYLDAVGWLHPDFSTNKIKKKRGFTPLSCLPETLEKIQQKTRETSQRRPKAFSKIETSRTEFFCVHKKGKHTPRLYLSMLRVHLHSGRTHQIRATLCSLGYPVVGDRIYGLDPEMYLRFLDNLETKYDTEKLRIGRTALHSFQLQFSHPITGEKHFFQSPLPEDMASLYSFTSRFSS